MPPEAGGGVVPQNLPENSKLDSHMLLNDRNGKLVCNLIVRLSFLLPIIQLNNTL